LSIFLGLVQPYEMWIEAFESSFQAEQDRLCPIWSAD